LKLMTDTKDTVYSKFENLAAAVCARNEREARRIRSGVVNWLSQNPREWATLRHMTIDGVPVSEALTSAGAGKFVALFEAQLRFAEDV